MSVEKIIKLGRGSAAEGDDPFRAAVTFRGTGKSTVSLNELALDNQKILSNTFVEITDIFYNVKSLSVIERAGNVIWILEPSGQNETSSIRDFPIKTNPWGDISVNLSGEEPGEITINLKKTHGYAPK